MCLPVAGAVLQRRWPRGRDMKLSPCPPWHWRRLRVLAPSLGALRGPCPWPELSDTGGAGTCMAKAPCPSSLLVLGPRRGAGEGSGGCCLVLRRVLSCPHCSWVASRFLLQAGGTLSGDPWPTSTRAHGPEGAARLRGAPTPCLSPPELSGVNPSGSSLRGWGRAGHRLQGLGLIQAPWCCCGAKLPRAELEGPQWGSQWGWAAP